MYIEFDDYHAADEGHTLTIKRWHITPKQQWGVMSINGDVGSILAHVLRGEVKAQRGHLNYKLNSVAVVSLTEQQALLEAELANDDSDFIDKIDLGSTVHELIAQCSDSDSTTEQLIKQLDLSSLAQQGFRALSTGETRRVMIARAVSRNPDMLILDDPFAGLDIEHRAQLSSYLESLGQQTPLLLIFSRESDIPTWLDSIALFDQGELQQTLPMEQWQQNPVLKQIAHYSSEQAKPLAALMRNQTDAERLKEPLFSIENGVVEYSDKRIFCDLNWRIDYGQHWQIKGPNGSGKSTLLAMVFGDHPQCYSNDIVQFGRPRGSGESVWQIKQHIGMVSSALHLQYRVNCSALEVVLSGFYDSIGLYEQPSVDHIQQARQWLEVLGITHLAKSQFRSLDYGQQRLLIIARALAKRPALLILDEPYQGLDFFGRLLIKAAIELIAREKLSQILYVSHYQDDEIEAIHHLLELEYDPNKQCYVGKIADKRQLSSTA